MGNYDVTARDSITYTASHNSSGRVETPKDEELLFNYESN